MEFYNTYTYTCSLTDEEKTVSNVWSFDHEKQEITIRNGSRDEFYHDVIITLHDALKIYLILYDMTVGKGIPLNEMNYRNLRSKGTVMACEVKEHEFALAVFNYEFKVLRFTRPIGEPFPYLFFMDAIAFALGYENQFNPKKQIVR